MELQKLFFSQKNHQAHHHGGVPWRRFGGGVDVHRALAVAAGIARAALAPTPAGFGLVVGFGPGELGHPSTAAASAVDAQQL